MAETSPAVSAPEAGAPADDGHRLSEGERLAAPWYREATAAARTLARADRRGPRLMGHRLLRHLAFQRARLARVYQGLEPHERAVISVLPYLFDTDRPGLPGHVRGRAVHGLRGFEPNATIREAVVRLFEREPGPRALTRHKPPVRSLWIQGDVGTLVEGGPPQLTACVVLDLAELGDGALPAFEARGAAIADWAAGFGVGLAFVFLDPARTRAGDFGPLRNTPARSAEALDRFYRTAVHLAGELPAWWCVPAGTPPDQHARLAPSIVQSRVDGPGFFDLGPVRRPPEQVRLRAAVEALDRGELRPLPFVLALARLVVDLDGALPPACERLKLAIEGGSDAIVDPVLQTLDEVTEALDARGDFARAETLRRLAWLKVSLYLARTTSHAETFLDRFAALAGPCVARWGYTAAMLDLLDGLVGWPREKVDGLDRDVRDLLLHLYSGLTIAAREAPERFDQGAIAGLGRRLLALIGAESGRVRAHFTYLLGERRGEDHLVLLEQPDAPRRGRWAIHRHVVRDEGADQPGEEPMWTGESLAAAGSWAVVNGVFAEGTAVRPVGESKAGTAADLRDVFDRLRYVVGHPDPVGRAGERFREPRRTRRAALVASFDGALVPEAVEQAAIKLLPENWDILNYGRERHSRLRDVSLVSLDSWDAVYCRRFRGPQALMEALRALYREFDPSAPFEIPPEVLVPHGGSTRAVKNRLRQILRGAERVVHGARAGRRAFIYEVGGRFQVLRRDEGGVTVCGARSLRGATRLLGAVGEDPQRVGIDRLSPSLGELRAIAERQRTDPTAEICVGWRQIEGEGQILICDEIGRLYARRTSPRGLDPLLLRLVRRIIHRLRTRVRDTRTLRRVLRVFEMRDGGSLGEDVQLREDTVRVISRLAEPRPRHPELFLRGHLSPGRDGVSVEYDGRTFDPRERGRRFVVDLLQAMIADRDRYAQFDLFIEASSVRFGDAAGAARERGVVKHLRLIDLYERHLARGLRAIRDGGPAVMLSDRGFSRRTR